MPGVVCDCDVYMPSAVVAALSRSDGNIVRAAEMLGVSRPTLYDLMSKLQIK